MKQRELPPADDLSNWRSVRRWEHATRERLRRHHALWLHGWCIGLAVLLVMWGAAHLQMLAGSESLALRYGATLGAGYVAFLLLLRWWAGRVVGEDAGPDVGELPSVDTGGGSSHAQVAASDMPATFRSGGRGDFSGAGAEGGWDLGDAAGGAVDVAGIADDAAVVVVPVVVVFLAGLLVVLGAGSLLMLYFGSEVLLATAVELAFVYVSARTAVRVAREGWLSAAVRLTWKPLLGALLCAVLLGGLVDFFVPQARSLPHAVKLLRA